MKYIANPVEVDAQVIIGVGTASSEDGSLHLALGNGENFTAEKGMTARYFPAPGDYVVTQADGYVYLNPKDVFERKYRPAELNALELGAAVRRAGLAG